MAVLLIAFGVLIIIQEHHNYDEEGFWMTVTPTPIDSIETEHQLDKILNDWFVDMTDKKEDKYRYPPMHKRNDLRYLPYLWIMFNTIPLPEYASYEYKWYFSALFLNSKLDMALPKLERLFQAELPNIYSLEPEYGERLVIGGGLLDEDEDEIDDWETHWEREYINNELYCIDSLRVRVVGYADRSALEKLEQYYKERNQEKELAIYYKVMLGHEGNGDLAESYLQVLKPYLKEQPEFIKGIRTVLLRAALCDHNTRAQELCDSLGFSLCDYRLPRLDE